MKKLQILIFIFFCFTIYAQSNDSFSYKDDFDKMLKLSTQKDSDFYYPQLLDRFMKNDTLLTNSEIIAMLVGYTNSEKYKPYELMDREREIFKLNGNGDYRKALNLCNSLLEDYPFSLLGNREKSYANYKLNLKSDPDIYFNRFIQLTNAILWSGNGLNYDTSNFVLCPADGQTIIRFVLRRKIGDMGSGRSSEGYFHDILELIHDDGGSTKLYFNINHAMENSVFSKQLEEAAK